MNDTFSSVAVMAILVLCSAFFSATETAFSSLNKTRLKTLAEAGNRRAEAALALAEGYDKLISTILIGNNLVNIAVTAVATVFFVRHFGDYGATLATVVITVVILIFGEVSPKSIAKDCPENFALFATPVMRVLVWLFAPLNALFSQWKRALAKFLKITNDKKMSQAELLMLVEEVQQEGSIDTREGELLRNAISFADQRADDILTPRVDLEAIPVTASREDVAKVFAETKYSRLLVYEKNIDNIIGVIHQKNFYTAKGLTTKPLKEIMTAPVFVVKSARISQLLHQMQAAKSQVAVVLDEYGGTFGMVTMEDILEQLVGDIWDEHDDVVESIRKLEGESYQVEGATLLDDFARFFQLKLDSEVASVSGWVMEQLGTIPTEGDHFDYENLTVTVTAVEERRVARVVVEKH